MRSRSMATLFMTFLLALAALASSGPSKAPEPQPSGNGPARVSATAQDDEALRLEGEKRFRTNCGRCHQAPHKFPPRMMATIVRHMRVRAMITDDDMKLILRYMTQ